MWADTSDVSSDAHILVKITLTEVCPEMSLTRKGLNAEMQIRQIKVVKVERKARQYIRVLKKKNNKKILQGQIGGRHHGAGYLFSGPF